MLSLVVMITNEKIEILGLSRNGIFFLNMIFFDFAEDSVRLLNERESVIIHRRALI